MASYKEEILISVLYLMGGSMMPRFKVGNPDLNTRLFKSSQNIILSSFSLPFISMHFDLNDNTKYNTRIWKRCLALPDNLIILNTLYTPMPEQFYMKVLYINPHNK